MVAFADGVLNIKPTALISTNLCCLVISGVSEALLLKHIEDSRHIWEGNLDEVRNAIVDSVIDTHAGHGTVVVTFLRINR